MESDGLLSSTKKRTVTPLPGWRAGRCSFSVFDDIWPNVQEYKDKHWWGGQCVYAGCRRQHPKCAVRVYVDQKWALESIRPETMALNEYKVYNSTTVNLLQPQQTDKMWYTSDVFVILNEFKGAT